MTKLVSFNDESRYDWFATSGLFDWVVDFLRARVDDPGALEKMHSDAVSGYLFIDSLPDRARDQILRALREELIPAVDTELYPPPLDTRNNAHIFAARAKNLAKQAWALARDQAGVAAPTIAVSDEYAAAVSPGSFRRIVEFLRDGVGDPATRVRLARAVDGEVPHLDLRELPEPGRTEAWGLLRDEADTALGGGDARVLALMTREAEAGS